MNVDTAASIAALLLGAWLFASMFLWRHSPEQMANAARSPSLRRDERQRVKRGPDVRP